jgi:glycosyltransferase involved in cell wall biosynthesis
MRILHVNKFLYRRGGADGYMLDVSALQSERGDEIEYFAMSHPMNQPSRFAAYFPAYVEFEPSPESLSGKLKAAGRLMYSPAARAGIESVLKEFRPDVIHLHNIYHQLSPSLLRPIRREGIPAVMTLHDYKLACPTYLFLANGELCEACLGGHFYQAILKRCKDKSLAASTLNAVELTIHTATKAYSPVNLFVCPSHFIMSKMNQAGVFPERLRWVPNFIATSLAKPKRDPGGGVVYAGRLSQEKGVDVLIQAVARLGARLDIAGDGPQKAELQALGERLGAKDIHFHGHLSRADVLSLLRSAAVSVLPSRCHENQPLLVLESLACGVPVVGTKLGGVPELIRQGVDGDLVAPNAPDELADRIGAILSDPRRAYEMGQAGREKMDQEFSPSRHLQRLDGIYEEAKTLATR